MVLGSFVSCIQTMPSFRCLIFPFFRGWIAYLDIRPRIHVTKNRLAFHKQYVSPYRGLFSHFSFFPRRASSPSKAIIPHSTYDERDEDSGVVNTSSSLVLLQSRRCNVAFFSRTHTTRSPEYLITYLGLVCGRPFLVPLSCSFLMCGFHRAVWHSANPYFLLLLLLLLLLLHNVVAELQRTML